MKNIMFIFLLFLGFSSAQSQSLEVTLNKDSILLGNTVKVEFLIQNSDAEFDAPDFSDMDIISGPNYSSSIQIINGKRSSKKSISYILRPRDIGKYYIPPAHLEEAEATLHTDAISFDVYPNPLGIIEEPSTNHSLIFDSFQWPEFKFENELSAPKEKKSQSKAKIRKI